MARPSRILLLTLLIGGPPVRAAAQPPDPPPDHDGAVARARVHAQAEQFDQVVAALEPVPPGERGYEAHHLLGVAYGRIGRLTDARRSLQAAIALKPNSAVDHFELAQLYRADGKAALAIESYRAAERFGLDTPELHHGLAAAHFELGNYIGQVTTRRVMGGTAGRTQDGVYLIEPVANEPGRFFVAPPTSAIYHLQQALDGGLDGPNVQLLHADIWLEARRYDRAVHIYQTLEGKVPPKDRARYYDNFARACLGVDDFEGYLARLKQALALNGKGSQARLAEAHRTIAEGYNARGDLANYIRHLELSVDQDPESADLHYRLGNALYEAGQAEPASHQWRITLELQPDHPDRVRLLELVRDISARPSATP